MIPPLSLASNLTNQLISLSKGFLVTISNYQVSEKTQKIAIECFKGGTSAYFFSFGILELFQGISKKKEEESTLNKVINASTDYFNLHGGLLIGCGLLTLADALQEFGLLNLSTIGNLVSAATNVIFLCANIIALEENVRLFYELKETDWTKTNISEDELRWMKQSAFFGFISNLGYITATACLLFSGATAFTIIIAIFSCFSGGIKIIYDMSVWAKAQNLCSG